MMPTTTSEMYAALVRLRDDTDKALARLTPEMLPNSVINFADLSCVEAAWGVDAYGNARWVVVIEEASPDCLGLDEWLKHSLRQQWGDALIVRTQW